MLRPAADFPSKQPYLSLDLADLQGIPTGASPGGFGAVRGLWHTLVPFEAIGTFVYPEMYGRSRTHQAFEEDGALKDQKNQQRLEALLRSCLDHLRKILVSG